MVNFSSLIGLIKKELEHKSQQDLADELGIHQTTISTILRGERTIGMKTYQAIAVARPEWIRESEPTIE